MWKGWSRHCHLTIYMNISYLIQIAFFFRALQFLVSENGQVGVSASMPGFPWTQWTTARGRHRGITWGQSCIGGSYTGLYLLSEKVELIPANLTLSNYEYHSHEYDVDPSLVNFKVYGLNFFVKNSENEFSPENRRTNGTIRKCSPRAFQWMVMSVCFDNLKFWWQILFRVTEVTISSLFVLRKFQKVI
jgi:hypothetical protein